MASPEKWPTILVNILTTIKLISIFDKFVKPETLKPETHGTSHNPKTLNKARPKTLKP